MADHTSEPWEHLKKHGYAPGDYQSKCYFCGAVQIMDKQATTCRRCAEILHSAAIEQTKGEQQAEPVAWLRVIDEAMVVHHLGIADPTDDYETAKRKMNTLLCMAQDIGADFAKQAEPVQSAAWVDAYDMIDRFLRNNLRDDDYAEYSAALDSLYTAPQQQAEPVQPAQESAGHTRFRVTVVDNAHPSGIPLEQWVQRKPLTGEELQKVLYSVATSIDAFSIVMTHWPLVARATEAAHGIKEAK